jgi:hypothetical protein
MTPKTYTKEELRAFHKELEVYRITKTVAGQKCSYIDFDKYLIAKGALVRQSGGYGPAILEPKIALYEELTDKWDQLRDMLNKKAFAEAKRLEELAAMHS